MHILVTRPEAEAAALQRPLEAMGHQVSLAPMIEINFADAMPDEINTGAALIVTSRNGLRALERWRSNLLPRVWEQPLFAVGPGTAQLARSIGFQHVIEGLGTAAALVPVIASTMPPAAGALIHLAGDHVAFDLKAALTPLGYRVHQPVVYRSIAATSLPPEVAANLARGRIDAVVLMSPRSAGTFAELVSKLDLDDAARALRFICLSPSVAGPLTRWHRGQNCVASKPNVDEILLLISRLNEPFR